MATTNSTSFRRVRGMLTRSVSRSRGNTEGARTGRRSNWFSSILPQVKCSRIFRQSAAAEPGVQGLQADGYQRDTFCEVRRAFQVGGVAALIEEKCPREA